MAQNRLCEPWPDAEGGHMADGRSLPPDWPSVQPASVLPFRTPLSNDIILGRGNRYTNHPGNKRFYEIVDAHLPTYNSATSKFEKGVVVHSIFESISSSCRFVKRDRGTGMCTLADDKMVRQKISHAIRYRRQIQPGPNREGPCASTRHEEIHGNDKDSDCEDFSFAENQIEQKLDGKGGTARHETGVTCTGADKQDLNSWNVGWHTCALSQTSPLCPFLEETQEDLLFQPLTAHPSEPFLTLAGVLRATEYDSEVER